METSMTCLTESPNSDCRKKCRQPDEARRIGEESRKNLREREADYNGFPELCRNKKPANLDRLRVYVWFQMSLDCALVAMQGAAIFAP
jgi:hypothetical protein